MKTMMSTTHALKLASAAATAALAIGALAGCQGERSDAPPRQFLPDMDDSPKFKPQTQTEFFADGRAMREPVKGTVAFGNSSREDDPSRAGYLRASSEVYEGIDPKGKSLAENEPAYLRSMPASVLEAYQADRAAHGQTFADSSAAMQAFILRGQERFDIFCAACHGYHGEGGDPTNFTGGVVGRRWRYPVPSYHDPKYRNRDLKTGQDGYLFHVIRYGVPDPDPAKPPKMPAYADKVNELDAWAIVAYVRTLQAAWREPSSATTAAPAAPSTEVKQ